MKRSKVVPVLGILSGVIAIVLAVIIYTGPSVSATEHAGHEIPSGTFELMTDMDTGTRTSYSYYGGDAYTGIQQAAADTARNVVSLARINNKGFSIISRGLSQISSDIRNSALAVIDEMHYIPVPDYRLPFCAVLLVLGLGMIVSSLHALSEGSARTRYEADVLEALRNLSGNPPVCTETESNSAEEDQSEPQ